jgi:hypothetical protein
MVLCLSGQTPVKDFSELRLWNFTYREIIAVLTLLVEINHHITKLLN